MSEQMSFEQIQLQEKLNTGTSKTNNESFDKNGYLVVKNLWNPEELYRENTNEEGQKNYWGKKDTEFNYVGKEMQVEGSYSSYWHPKYRTIHSQIRLKLEKIIGKKLYNTYYYDRFYYPGQKLNIHADRPACEISVSVHISDNVKEKWPLWIKTPYGENHSVSLNPGDGMLYKGCERPHWRDPLPKEYRRTWYGKKVEKDGLYYHQVFFHYVLADGIRSHYAGDNCNC